MIVLHQNKEQLIIGADTRKTAVLTFVGFIILAWIVFSLLTYSPFFPKDRIVPVATGAVTIMCVCMAYYFYRVYGNIRYTFDKKTKILLIFSETLLGTKRQAIDLYHIQSIEERDTSTYAYHGHMSGAADEYHTTKNDNYYTTIVLHFSRKRELNLVPNAAYFFLHPFNHLTDEIDHGLGKVIADFLDVPLVKQQLKRSNLVK